MRSGIVSACLALACLGSMLAPAAAAEAWLLRVERRATDDLDVLVAAGVPVVHEMETCLFVEGDAGHAQWLDDHGYRTLLLDDAADEADYVVVGIRPDSETGKAHEVGTVLHREANWMLLRVSPGEPLVPLATAKMFVTRLSHDSARPSRPAPPSRETRFAGIDAPPDPLVQKIVDDIDTADIDLYWTDLASNPPTGTRYSTHQGCSDAADYCMTVYQGLGIPAELQEWDASHAPNVVATQVGALYPDRVYIVEGHLDDLPSSPPAPGADDNASGSVTVLEAANALSCYGVKSTVKYLNVTGEEFGLYGSNDYADDAYARNEDIRAVINMDMNGWEGNNDPNPENLDLNYNGPSEWLGLLFAECAQKYGTGLAVDAFYCPSLTASDHYPFWQNGYHAICGITDNEGYCGHGGNYPYYHTSDDTIANCGDPTFFYGAVKASVATLAEMAEPFKITFSKAYYGCGSNLGVLLGDRDLNQDPGLAETVAVEVWSDTESIPEAVLLTERGVDDMVFDGMLAVTDQPPASGDGFLSVLPGDSIHARYVDALDCDGATGVTYTADAAIDCVFPVIANVDESGITDTSATVIWDTDEGATSVVRWGETVPPTNPAASAGMDVAHSVQVDGLQSCTVYYYEVESADEAGNVAVDDNGGQYYRFETYGDFGAGLQPCHAGRASLAADVYGCGEVVAFEVVDMDLNIDPGVAETVMLTVTSTTETAVETVVATETGTNTSRFGGSILAAAGAPAADGVLQVGHGDVITVTYLDEDDGTGASALSFDVSSVDCDGPAIRNLRVEAVTDQRMTVRFETDEPGDTIVEWGTTPALGEIESDPAATTDHVAVLNRLDMCETVYLRVTSTDASGNTAVADMGGQPAETHTWDVPGLYWRETFEGDVSGWDLQGEWEIGSPQGLGGSSGNPDPVAAYNSLTILGNDLSGQGSYSGDYEHLAYDIAISPEFNAQTWTNTRLLLYRQLNVRDDDVAAVSVMKRNKETPIYTNDHSTVSQGGYSAAAWDLSSVVDGERTVNLRFGIQADGQSTFFDDGVSSGWNIDDVILKDGSLPDYAPCGGCIQAPAFAGVGEALDNDACGAGGVTVQWPPAVSWGTGGPGTYSVYRDTTPGFTPSVSNRIATGVAGLAHDDVSAPTDTTLYYLVRAENDETCGGGPANSGLTDANLAYAEVQETTTRPAPDDHDGLRAEMVNDAHLRLSWGPVAGATGYRVYRSDAPDRATFVMLDETAGLIYEDLNQGGNANTFYYLVRGANPCGDEGP